MKHLSLGVLVFASLSMSAFGSNVASVDTISNITFTCARVNHLTTSNANDFLADDGIEFQEMKRSFKESLDEKGLLKSSVLAGCVSNYSQTDIHISRIMMLLNRADNVEDFSQRLLEEQLNKSSN